MNAGNAPLPAGDPWDCQAYGPEGTTIGALCFFSPELGSRVCCTQGECQDRLNVERRLVFDRIQDMAAAGDPVGEYLAGEFTTPGQILGGGQDQDNDPRAET